MAVIGDEANCSTYSGTVALQRLADVQQTSPISVIDQSSSQASDADQKSGLSAIGTAVLSPA